MLKGWCLKAVLAGIVSCLLVIVLVSCSSGGKPEPVAAQDPGGSQDGSPAATFAPFIPRGRPANPMKQITIDAKVSGDQVSVLLGRVTSNWNTRFAVPTEQGERTFMAYVADSKVQVRADICPPCRSRSFTLSNKGTLVCDACGTVFDASSGKGITGACVAYPKEAAPYEIVTGSIVMSKADLITAYEKTLEPN